jgi:hypothetical protein
MIIDPTDYQFNSIDLNALPLETKYLIPNDDSIEKCQTKEEIHDVMLRTYLENNYKRYKENPNEKEKRFMGLTEQMKSGSIDPESASQELQTRFGSEIFYDKNDKRFEYRVNKRS